MPTARTRLGSHDDVVQAVAYSPEGVLASAGGAGDGSVRIWDRAGGRRMTGARDRPMSVRFDVSGTRLLAHTHAGEVLVWKLSDSSAPLVFSDFEQDPEACMAAADFSPSGELVASVCTNAGIYLFPLDGGERRIRWTTQRGASAIAFSADGRRVLALFESGAVVWDLGSDAATDVAIGLRYHNAAAISPDGRRVALAAGADLLLLEVDTGVKTPIAAGHTDSVVEVAFTPDGRLLTAARDGTARLLDLAGTTPPLVLAHGDALHGVRLAGKHAGVTTAASDAFIWALDAGAPPLHASDPHAAATAITFDAAGRRLAIGYEQGYVDEVELAPAAHALLTTEVTWLRTGDAEHPYAANALGAWWMIRVNDFPEYPTPYTLRSASGELIDVMDWPSCWKRPS